MPAADLREYRLHPAALTDIDAIWDFTAQKWSVDQADAYLRGLFHAFASLIDFPERARERTEFDPPVRLLRCQSHLIIYRIEADHIAIIRVPHMQQNWGALLGE